MFNKVIETIVGGAIGAAALYVVAKVSYQMGYDVSESRHNREKTTDDNHEEPKSEDEEVTDEDEPKEHDPPRIFKPGKWNLLLALKSIRKKGKHSFLGELMNDPEDHKLEAYIHEGEVHISIKKRRSLAA